MEGVLKIVRTFRVNEALADQLRLAEGIFILIEPDLRLFLLGSISPSSAEGVLQEVLEPSQSTSPNLMGRLKNSFGHVLPDYP